MEEEVKNCVIWKYLICRYFVCSDTFASFITFCMQQPELYEIGNLTIPVVLLTIFTVYGCFSLTYYVFYDILRYIAL